jgi:Fe-S-cluster containining protein
VKPPSHVAAVETLHAEIDRATAPLAALHAERLACRAGCASCCVDELTVTEVEADRIRSWAGETLRGATAHAEGACPFLDGDARCRIYPARPQVCRTQGLPLRWFEEDEDEEIVERRAICPLNLAGPALELLDEEALWLIGPTEIELWSIQDAAGFDPDARVSLRALFAELSVTSPDARPKSSS